MVGRCINLRRKDATRQLGLHWLVIDSRSNLGHIANYLDRETMQIDMLSKEISNTIGLLKERRSALITAAVTGQIDLKEIIA